MSAEEKLTEASTFEILKGMMATEKFIKMCITELINRGIEPLFVEKHVEHIRTINEVTP